MELVVSALGAVRREKRGSRDYLVAPLTLIVPGVLNGSKGPLYYPPEEVSADPGAWNGMPLVVYHPSVDGLPVSARDPDVLHNQGVGHVYRVEVKNGNLTGEGWFDVDALKRVDVRVLNALQRGEPIELSTGLFTTNEPAADGATHNGKPYTATARGYRPDHVAILPDQVGACSLADGCGVLVNGDEMATWAVENGLVVNPMGQWEPPDAGEGAPKEVRDILRRVYSEFRDKNPAENPATKSRGAKIAWGAVKRAGWRKGADGMWHKMGSKQTMNREEAIGYLTANCDCWKAAADRDVLNTFTDDKLAALKAAAEKAKAQEAVVNTARAALKLPADLTLNAMSAAMEAKCREMMAAEKPAANTLGGGSPPPAQPPVKPQTTDEWLATAPVAVRTAVQNAMLIEQREREHLVARLVANAPDDASRQAAAAVYGALGLDALRPLVAALPAPATPALPAAGALPGGFAFPSYLGAAGAPATNRLAALDPNDVPREHTWDWAELSGLKLK